MLKQMNLVSNYLDIILYGATSNCYKLKSQHLHKTLLATVNCSITESNNSSPFQQTYPTYNLFDIQHELHNHNYPDRSLPFKL